MDHLELALALDLDLDLDEGKFSPGFSSDNHGDDGLRHRHPDPAIVLPLLLGLMRSTGHVPRPKQQQQQQQQQDKGNGALAGDAAAEGSEEEEDDDWDLADDPHSGNLFATTRGLTLPQRLHRLLSRSRLPKKPTAKKTNANATDSSRRRKRMPMPKSIVVGQRTFVRT